MINSQMKTYNYYQYSQTEDDYGQDTLSLTTASGTIKMAINLINQGTTDSILYKESSYVGLTMGSVTDDIAIKYGNEYLKVLYINDYGKYKQVFMGRM